MWNKTRNSKKLLNVNVTVVTGAYLSIFPFLGTLSSTAATLQLPLEDFS